jgi:trehalose synthase
MGELLERHRKFMLPGRAEILEGLGRKLKGTSFLRVNSTKQGGGVAEMIQSLEPLFRDLGINHRWEVIKGTSDFYALTKSFHNALQGRPMVLSPAMKALYLDIAQSNAAALDLNADAVLIDDPQPAALVEKRSKSVPWMWRCHIDLSRPDRELWQFLRTYVEKYDGAIFSLPRFARRMLTGQYLVWPAIDPLSDKNRELPDSEVDAILQRLKVPRDKPIVLQVSRFDRFKDPVGVIKAFKWVRKRAPCTLVLAGGGADDDPEGPAVLQEVMSAGEGDPDIKVLLLPPTAHVEINALQRAADVVVQKSTREGFGLTVTEALWKGKPVIGGYAGGIAVQIIHGVTGFLVSSSEGAGFRILTLLENPDLARRMGEEGREHVRRNFLITRNLRDLLVLTCLLKEQRS